MVKNSFHYSTWNKTKFFHFQLVDPGRSLRLYSYNYNQILFSLFFHFEFDLFHVEAIIDGLSVCSYYPPMNDCFLYMYIWWLYISNVRHHCQMRLFLHWIVSYSLVWCRSHSMSFLLLLFVVRQCSVRHHHHIPEWMNGVSIDGRHNDSRFGTCIAQLGCPLRFVCFRAHN